MMGDKTHITIHKIEVKVIFPFVKQPKQLQRKPKKKTSLKPQTLFSGFSLQLLKLLHNCQDHFQFYSLSTVHIYDLYPMHIISIHNIVD